MNFSNEFKSAYTVIMETKFIIKTLKLGNTAIYIYIYVYV